MNLVVAPHVRASSGHGRNIVDGSCNTLSFSPSCGLLWSVFVVAVCRVGLDDCVGWRVLSWVDRVVGECQIVETIKENHHLPIT